MYILYYSGYCVQCQKLLRILSCAPPALKNQIHFVCIDARKQDPDTGKIMLYLDNGVNMVMPANIHRVPAMILVTKGNRVVFGCDDIVDFLQSGQTQNSKGPAAALGVSPANQTKNTCFAPTTQDLVCHEFGANSGSSLMGVESDKFSFFSALTSSNSSNSGSIFTPEEDYSRTKMSGDITLEKLVAQRNSDVPMAGVNMSSFKPTLPQMPSY